MYALCRPGFKKQLGVLSLAKYKVEDVSFVVLPLFTCADMQPAEGLNKSKVVCLPNLGLEELGSSPVVTGQLLKGELVRSANLSQAI